MGEKFANRGFLLLILMTLETMVSSELIEELSLGEAGDFAGNEPDKRVVEESVNAALRFFDSNEDGVIGLSELESVIQGYISMISGPGASPFDQWKEGAMTLARAHDTDQTGVLERRELEQFMTSLLRESGSVMAAKILDWELYWKFTLDQIQIPRGRKLMSVALSAIDRDKDRVVSMEEIEDYYNHSKVTSNWKNAKVLAEDADYNGDGKLARKELFDWVNLLRQFSVGDIRQMMTYGEIKGRLGADLANQWLDL